LTIGEMTETLDGQDMNCQICGRASVPGAKLCSDCRSARKRAFDATVTQPLLAAAAAGRASRSSSRLLRPRRSSSEALRRAAIQTQAARAASADKARSRARWPLAVAGLAIVFLAGAYVTQHFGATTKTGEPAQAHPDPALGDVPVATRTAPATANSPAMPKAAPTGVPAAPVLTQVPIFIPPPTGIYTGTESAKRPNARARAAAPVAAALPPEPPPVEAVPVPAPAPPVVREAPRPDPWQPMNDALARCPRDEMSGRMMCEQRVRTRYCDGQWGQVPQCASIPYTDHGG
jgi:hypothetical protein